MPYLFSPSELAFFHTDIPFVDLPADVREIADEDHERLMQDLLMRGKILQADDQGMPETVSRGEGIPVSSGADDEPGLTNDVVPNTAQDA